MVQDILLHKEGQVLLVHALGSTSWLLVLDLLSTETPCPAHLLVRRTPKVPSSLGGAPVPSWCTAPLPSTCPEPVDLCPMPICPRWPGACVGSREGRWSTAPDNPGLVGSLVTLCDTRKSFPLQVSAFSSIKSNQ